MNNENRIKELIEKNIGEDAELESIEQSLRSRGIIMKELFYDVDINTKDVVEADIKFKYDFYIKDEVFNEFNEIDSSNVETLDDSVFVKSISIKSLENNEEEDETNDLLMQEDMLSIEEFDMKNIIKTKSIYKSDELIERKNEIQNDCNKLFADFQNALVNLTKDINVLLQKHFGHLRDNSDVDMKQKIKDFLNDLKTKRVKKFVRNSIKTNINLTYLFTKGEMKTKRRNIIEKFLNKKKGASYGEMLLYIQLGKKLKDYVKRIKNLKKDYEVLIDEMIDDSYVEVLKDAIVITKTIKKDYDKEMDVEVDNYLLLNMTWDKTKIIFQKNQFNQRDFKNM